eukprot:5916452-Alexandrium_andersonii.AAC.1
MDDDGDGMIEEDQRQSSEDAQKLLDMADELQHVGESEAATRLRERARAAQSPKKAEIPARRLYNQAVHYEKVCGDQLESARREKERIAKALQESESALQKAEEVLKEAEQVRADLLARLEREEAPRDARKTPIPPH